MRVYTTRTVYPQTYTRGRGEVQLQRYTWHLHQEGGEAKEKNNRFHVLEIRPNCANGFIHTIKIECPFASNFDTMILNEWDFCSDHPQFDGTAAYENTIHVVASWEDTDRILYDAAVGPVYFQSAEKAMKTEKENRQWPRRGKVMDTGIPGGTIGADETHVPEPCLALVIEVDTNNNSDTTVIIGEIAIEGQFPKHYLRSQLR